MTNAEDFDFDAGELCLDFANTAEWHASEQPAEYLNDYQDLLTWGTAADLLPADRVRDLRQLAGQQTEKAAAVYNQAIELREAIYKIFSSLSRGERVNADDIAVLNVALSAALRHLLVSPSSTGFSWEWEASPEALDQVLWPAARSAAELLTADKLKRVSQCADDRGCGYLFIDTSRNRSRRWCSMKSCGNRAKATRHYKRIRDAK